MFTELELWHLYLRELWGMTMWEVGEKELMNEVFLPSGIVWIPRLLRYLWAQLVGLNLFGRWSLVEIITCKHCVVNNVILAVQVSIQYRPVYCAQLQRTVSFPLSFEMWHTKLTENSRLCTHNLINQLNQCGIHQNWVINSRTILDHKKEANWPSNSRLEAKLTMKLT